MRFPLPTLLCHHCMSNQKIKMKCGEGTKTRSCEVKVQSKKAVGPRDSRRKPGLNCHNFISRLSLKSWWLTFRLLMPHPQGEEAGLWAWSPEEPDVGKINNITGKILTLSGMPTLLRWHVLGSWASTIIPSGNMFLLLRLTIALGFCILCH